MFHFRYNHCRTDQCSPIIKIATKSTKKDKVSEQVYIYKRGLKPSGIIHNTKIQNIFIRHNNILGADNGVLWGVNGDMV